MISVVVCVYDRFENLKTWISCWKQSKTDDAELIIVHNYYGHDEEKEKYQYYCKENNVKYVARNGQGFDIGALQDVYAERLDGFPNDWQYLLWCTDDCLPMSKDFITPFLIQMRKPGIGVACMQISQSIATHVRTTGFMIRKDLSKKIVFPADPMTNKQQCYLFEHRGGKTTFTQQVLRLGLKVVEVADIKTSPLWDSLHPNRHLRLNRQAEFNEVWSIRKRNEKILFITPIFDKFPQIISSLICQNENSWELLLIDDNPDSNATKKIVDNYNDSRVKYVKKERQGNYGHPLRKWALQEIKNYDCDYICIGNPDNYYTPNFIKEVRAGFQRNPFAVAVYVDKMVHSYKNWDVIPCKLQRGYLDCGGVVIRKDIACEVGWQNVTDHSADWFFFQDIANKYSWANFKPIHGCMFVHN